MPAQLQPQGGDVLWRGTGAGCNRKAPRNAQRTSELNKHDNEGRVGVARAGLINAIGPKGGCATESRARRHTASRFNRQFIESSLCSNLEIGYPADPGDRPYLHTAAGSVLRMAANPGHRQLHRVGIAPAGPAPRRESADPQEAAAFVPGWPRGHDGASISRDGRLGALRRAATMLRLGWIAAPPTSSWAVFGEAAGSNLADGTGATSGLVASKIPDDFRGDGFQDETHSTSLTGTIEHLGYAVAGPGGASLHRVSWDVAGNGPAALAERSSGRLTLGPVMEGRCRASEKRSGFDRRSFRIPNGAESVALPVGEKPARILPARGKGRRPEAAPALAAGLLSAGTSPDPRGARSNRDAAPVTNPVAAWASPVKPRGSESSKGGSDVSSR